MEKMVNNNFSKFKGGTIHYICEECHMYKDFDVIFDKNTSKIEGDTCSHFYLKFLGNTKDNGHFEYIVKFNCRNCGKEKVLIYWMKT